MDLGIERLVNGGFNPHDYREWLNAVEHLIANIDDPDVCYKNFKMVQCNDGEWVFGNCILPGITHDDVLFLTSRPHVISEMRRLITQSVH